MPGFVEGFTVSPASFVAVDGALLPDCSLLRLDCAAQLDDRDCCSNDAARLCASPIVDGSNCAIAVWICGRRPPMKRETSWT